MRLPVLLYHHVGPQRAGGCPSLTVPPDRFERHVRCLARQGYVGIRPSEWHECLSAGRAARRPVLLTFDDAYADILEYAVPVLQRYRFSAAIMVVTGRVGGASEWDRAQGWVPHPLMTADQIRECAARGMELGAHSRTHADLTTASDHDLDDEIFGSSDDLSLLIGSRVATFAFPYGRFNERVLRRVRQAYDMAFSCVEGVNTLATDYYQMHRSMVQPYESQVGLTWRVRTGRYPMDRVRAQLRLRSRLRDAAASLRCGDR